MKDTVVVNGKFGSQNKTTPRQAPGDRSLSDRSPNGRTLGKPVKAAAVQAKAPPRSGLIDKAVPAKALSSDFTLGAVGCGLAFASVSFGVYMNVHGPAPHEPGKDFSVFAQLAPRAEPVAKSIAAERTTEPLDMTATASIPRRGSGQDVAAPSTLVEAADTNGATISVDGRPLKVHVGDTIPGIGEVLAIYPGARPLVKTSRGTILAVR